MPQRNWNGVEDAEEEAMISGVPRTRVPSTVFQFEPHKRIVFGLRPQMNSSGADRATVRGAVGDRGGRVRGINNDSSAASLSEWTETAPVLVSTNTIAFRWTIPFRGPEIRSPSSVHPIGAH